MLKWNDNQLYLGKICVGFVSDTISVDKATGKLYYRVVCFLPGKEIALQVAGGEEAKKKLEQAAKEWLVKAEIIRPE